MKASIVYVLISDAGKIRTISSPFVPTVPDPRDQILDFEEHLLAPKFKAKLQECLDQGLSVCNWHVVVEPDAPEWRPGLAVPVIVSDLIAGTQSVSYEE